MTEQSLNQVASTEPALTPTTAPIAEMVEVYNPESPRGESVCPTPIDEAGFVQSVTHDSELVDIEAENQRLNEVQFDSVTGESTEQEETMELAFEAKMDEAFQENVEYVMALALDLKDGEASADERRLVFNKADLDIFPACKFELRTLDRSNPEDDQWLDVSTYTMLFNQNENLIKFDIADEAATDPVYALGVANSVNVDISSHLTPDYDQDGKPVLESDNSFNAVIRFWCFLGLFVVKQLNRKYNVEVTPELVKEIATSMFNGRFAIVPNETSDVADKHTVAMPAYVPVEVLGAVVIPDDQFKNIKEIIHVSQMQQIVKPEAMKYTFTDWSIVSLNRLIGQ